MKKYIKIKPLFLLLFGFNVAFSQNIVFNDIEFKAKLFISNQGILPDARDLNGNLTLVDTNNDGQINRQEALNISYLNLEYAAITSLEGLQYFTNLMSLSVQTFALPFFNYPTLINLSALSLSSIVNDGALTTFDVSGNISLRKLTLKTGRLSSVDLSNNTQLTELNLQGSTEGFSLSNLNLSNLVNLRKLNY